MSDTLTDRIDAHLAKARAAHEKGAWGFGMTPHIAANDPATIEAFCAVAMADDPEPEYRDTRSRQGLSLSSQYWEGESETHIAWRHRQELKAALADALGKE